MNRIITQFVKYRGSTISVEQLKEQSQIEIEVECKHGRRLIRWCRRNQLCKKCSIEVGAFNTSKPGREITWGDKISKAKKGIKASDAHKKALSIAHLGIALSQSHKDAQNKNRLRGEKHPSWKNLSNEHRKIRKRISNAVNMKLKRRGFFKDSSISECLPYSIEDLCKHFESKFTEGMTWDNYGDWHIDHVKPDSWFTYSSTDDQGFKDSWALENLQPLWAKDNISKNNRFIG